ncbi:retrovirus-related pol polyprotein from transposon TNT 1-94-like protein [Citrus sinensis]|nr:retrovirus-related pol polyprotein from transposon TNT 1-94-like protein [Citrus sinensis]
MTQWVGIWIVGSSSPTNNTIVVWTARREDPVVSSGAALQFSVDGSRVLLRNFNDEVQSIAEPNKSAVAVNVGVIFNLSALSLALDILLFLQVASLKNLTGTNFKDWCESILFYLSTLNRDLALRVDEPAKPTDKSIAAEKAEWAAWDESNRHCLDTMKYTIDRTLEIAFLHVIRPKITWQLLEELLRREHILKMTNYHKKLKDMDVNLPDDYLVFQILESLPLQFGNLRSQYNTQRDTWNITELTTYVVQEEESLKKGKSHTVMVATTQESGSVKKGSSKGSNKFFKKKKFGKKTSHGNSSTTSGSTSDNFKGKCHFCKKPGHKRAECRGFKAWLEKKGIPVAFVGFESNLVDVPSDTWWLDTGATINITNSLQEFKSRREPNEGELIVHMGNGVTTKVESIGVVRLHLATCYVLDLLDRVYIPSIRRNLISVSILDRYGYTFHFGDRKVYLFRNSELVGSDTLYDGLYMIDLFSRAVESSSNAHVMHVVSSTRARVDENSSMLWHKRLGHISKQRMERLIKDDILHNLDFSDFGTCVDCIKGKLTAKVRKERTRRSQQVLELVHTYICGPFTLIAIGGYKYFITFIDDFSRYGQVELLTEKSESLSVFQAFKANVELQKGKKIKAVRSDRCGEYYGRYDETGRNPGPFAKFLQECGIEAQYTMPGTPEQNGIAERRNRTLLDMVRCMLSNSTLPDFLWGEALRTAAYILNQVPSSRGSRFYCPSHTTRIIESDRAIYFEDDHNSVSFEPRSLTLREERVVLPIPSFPTSATGLPHIDDSSVDPELHHDMEPMIIEDDGTDVPLRRSERIRRPAISDDYVVYLQEHDFDADSSYDPITFQEAISCSESLSWLHAMHDEMAVVQILMYSQAHESIVV